MRRAYSLLLLIIVGCSSSDSTGPSTSLEEGAYTLTAFRGVPVPTQNILRGSVTLGPAHAFRSTEYDGTGSTVTDSVFQTGTYTVNGTDTFGTSIMVHIASGTDNGQPLVLPPGGVNLNFRLSGSTLIWLAGTQPFFTYSRS